MLRIRIRSGGRGIAYTNIDVVKDAAINMLEAAGAPVALLSGPDARLWSVGAICSRKLAPRQGSTFPLRLANEVVVSTPDPEIAAYLSKADPSAMRKVQPATGEDVDMSGADIVPDVDPVVPGTSFIEAFALTPILVSRKGDRGAGKWHGDVRQVDISQAVSHRLSRLSGRRVALSVAPDELYLSGRGTHAVRVDVKATGGKPGVVVGMMFPFTILGSPDDLRLAWYAGIGERNRQGFGLFGLAA
ncbi:MAG TPA: CRISPR-associated endoribonuclease Cas6 [Arenibaculum sp.]|nr:CRISPR-associated endoribonuclease Cas6 [Arenibaculum sp.]